MERRGGGQKELGNNSTESPVKLPLAPIFSAPPDRRSNIAASFSTRRGSSIFSPTQTLAHPYIPPPPPPPPHHHEATSPDPDPASDSKSSAIRYKECLRNHAASMGAHVVDGCGEFMPAGEDGTPESLRCAACDCHRNFHRKETDGERAPQLPQRLAPHLKRQLSAAMVSFGAATESSSEDLNMSESAKKRFRTKFSQEQKDRMHELATRLEWRIQKRDEEEVQRFCGEVGVKRQVLKVWMHNNKQAMNKRHTSADD